MRTVAEALSQILECVEPAAHDLTFLPDCLMRVLAADLQVPHDSPPFDKSMMDGFAVNSTSLQNTSEKARLAVLETLTAGNIPTQPVTAGCATRIMTGAAVPEGADCVVPIERVQFDESAPEHVTVFLQDVSSERHILRRGRLAVAGDTLLNRGVVIEPQHIAVLAEFGMAKLPVSAIPRVAVLATGDELLPFDAPLTPGHIRNSNEPMLVSQIQRASAKPVALGIAADNAEQLSSRIRAGLECDFLLLSGGVSAGTLDLVPAQLEAAGVVEVFHKIAMKPGKPLWFGMRKTQQHTCWVFGLPGNPVSSMICFELFVRPALRQFRGQPHPGPQPLQATLQSDVRVRGNRVTYYPAVLGAVEAGFQVRPVDWGGSADLRSTAQANSMCILEPRENAWAAGEVVPVIPWSGF